MFLWIVTELIRKIILLVYKNKDSKMSLFANIYFLMFRFLFNAEAFADSATLDVGRGTSLQTNHFDVRCRESMNF